MIETKLNTLVFDPSKIILDNIDRQQDECEQILKHFQNYLITSHQKAIINIDLSNFTYQKVCLLYMNTNCTQRKRGIRLFQKIPTESCTIFLKKQHTMLHKFLSFCIQKFTSDKMKHRILIAS